MYKSIIAILILSCVNSAAIKKTQIIDQERKQLEFIKKFETSRDTTIDKEIVKYDKLHLTQEYQKEGFAFFLRGNKIFSGFYENYHYLTEVFNGTHLLISYAPGPNYASNMDDFERDSILIIDLKTEKRNIVSLRKIYLTRSLEFLFKYHRYVDTIKYKDAYRYCAIDSIDLNSHKLILINQDKRKEEFKTFDISK